MAESSDFDGLYDGVADSLIVGEYFPIAGDRLSSNDNVQSTTSFESYIRFYEPFDGLGYLSIYS